VHIVVVGAGPAGLAFAIARAASVPGDCITVVDRRPAGARPGFGITLRSGAFEALGIGDLLQGPALQGRALWYRGVRVIDLPNPDQGQLVTMARSSLVEALVRRAVALGVDVRWEVDAADIALEGYDLVVGADGASSPLRARLAEHFRPVVEEGQNWFAWLGTTRLFPKLTIAMHDEEIPLLAWAYQYAEDRSTLIVERSTDSFAPPMADALETLSRVLRPELEGHPVLAAGSAPRWRRFPTVRCERLVHDNVVLIGDAAHTTHFSQGFGTLFALDDAHTLCRSLEERGSPADAARAYEATQQPKIEAYQATCAQSMRWGESVTRALDAADDEAVRELVEARWPDNAVTPAPLDSP